MCNLFRLLRPQCASNHSAQRTTRRNEQLGTTNHIVDHELSSRSPTVTSTPQRRLELVASIPHRRLFRLFAIEIASRIEFSKPTDQRDLPSVDSLYSPSTFNCNKVIAISVWFSRVVCELGLTESVGTNFGRRFQ